MATPHAQGIFCNRTLNLRGIRAVGYDMDYTLVHYRVDQWEACAWHYLQAHFAALGWSVDDLTFEPQRVCRGLILDTLHGNIVKANRFGFIKRAAHGTRPIEFEEQRRLYARTIVDLSEPRWVFLNSLFSISEGCLYAQLVDRLDAHALPGVLGYSDLYAAVRAAADVAHMEGRLKAEILADPDRFVVLDPGLPLALLDQKHAGKVLMLITNSEWAYTVPMMAHAFDRYLPPGTTWRDLFDIVVVGARKPEFFTTESPFFEVVTPEGLLSPPPFGAPLRKGSVYLGGSARQLERHLGMSGEEILYIGDHMFGDVRVTKSVLRWRTALILRELEDEIAAEDAFRDDTARITTLMARKEPLEAAVCTARVALERLASSYGPPPQATAAALHEELTALVRQIDTLDSALAPLVIEGAALYNPHWGLLMRAGNDKSHLAYQIERYADVYTSRVSNFLIATPYAYFRSPRGSLPHDRPG